MAGFPHHQLESYLAKLIAAGFRAAVCEQVEDPQAGQGTGSPRSDAGRHARHDHRRRPARSAREQLSGGDGCGRSGRPGMGRAFHGPVRGGLFPAAPCPINWPAIAPAECLLAGRGRCLGCRGQDGSVTRRPGWAFSPNRPESLKHFGTASLEGFGFDQPRRPGRRAAGAVLDYLTETQKTSLAHVDRLIPYRSRPDAGDRRIEPPQPGDYAHHPRGPPRGLAPGVLDRTGHGDGRAAAGRLAGQPADRRGGDHARQEAVAELVLDARLGDDLRDREEGV